MNYTSICKDTRMQLLSMGPVDFSSCPIPWENSFEELEQCSNLTVLGCRLLLPSATIYSVVNVSKGLLRAAIGSVHPAVPVLGLTMWNQYIYDWRTEFCSAIKQELEAS